MKTKSIIILTVIALILAVTGFAQTNPPLFVKGNIDIKYYSRYTPTPVKGSNDVYTLNVNVANSVLFDGVIIDTPQIIDGYFTKSVVQPRSLSYDIACDVIRPNSNPIQKRNVGRILGKVPINSDGTYRYDLGLLEISVIPIGTASGFTSKFGGTVAGKPLVRPANWFETLKQEAVNITRTQNGKTTTITLNKYDKLVFNNHVLASGPIASYGSAVVSGELFYDYDKAVWFFRNIILQYTEGNTVKISPVGGTIRWDKKLNEYDFDIRFDEAPSNANAVFESKASDESSFFEVDLTGHSLTGKMSYKDVKRGETTLSSQVAINLTANNLTKFQVFAITKLILFSSVIPMNSD